MAAPWIDVLGAAYLAGEASLFVLHVRDRDAACAELVQRLSATREIVGIVRSDGLTFPNLGDLSRFEQLWQARRVLAGGAVRADALAKIWAVLEVSTVSQGWIVRDGEVSCRARAPSEGPALATWVAAPRLREANHLVVVLACEISRLDPALLAAARVIDATRVLLSEPLETPVESTSEAGDAVPPPDDLAALLSSAFGDYLVGWPAPSWPSRAPFLAAITEVLAASGAIAPVAVQWDPDKGLQLTGDGAATFRTIWSADLALDGALGNLARDWKIPEAGFQPGELPAPDPTGMRVLVRRLERGFYAARKPADG